MPIVFAADELDRRALEEAGEHELVDVLRQRRRGRVRAHGIEPERDGDLEPAVREQVVRAAVLVDLPVHQRRAPVDLLHPVHADVARAVARVVRDHRRERDERRRVARPAALDRQQVEVDVVAREDDLLRRRRRARSSGASRRSTSASAGLAPSPRDPRAAASRARRRACARRRRATTRRTPGTSAAPSRTG